MSDDEALLKAITENPDDDLPRLVFSDWLDEHGDPERAEFIRIQCRLARLSADEDGHRLEVRANELLARHEDEWAAPLRGMVLWRHFRRGFVERVGVEARTFLDRPADLFRLAPVRSAHIRTTPSELPAVTASPYLARLRVLGVGDGLGDAGAELLAGSPGLTAVEEINLLQGRIGPAGAEALARSPHLSRLTALWLGWNLLGDPGVQALAESHGLSRLCSLDVSGNNIGSGGVRALAAGTLVGRLDFLLLSHNLVGLGGARALAESAVLGERGRLSILGLCGCGLGDLGAACIAAAPWAAGLRRLDLRANDIGEAGVEALIESPFLTGLAHLFLTGNRLTDEDRFRLRGRFGMTVQL